MKKHLLALAVAAAVAAPAMAQNVSIYGVIDASVEQINQSNNLDYTYQKTTDPRGSSVLGFKGAEDLGGGMKAEFVLEGDLNVDDGSGDPTGGTSTGVGFTFDRHSYIGVSGGFGTIRVGRTSLATEDAYSFAGGGYNYFLPIASREVAGKNAGTIKYISPSFSGVTVTVTDTGRAGTNGFNESSNSLGVTYATGKLVVGAAIGESESNAGAQLKTSIYNASYDFGVASVAFSHQVNDVADDKTTTLTGKMPLGGGLTAVVSYQNLKDNNTANTSAKQWGGALEKALSKRTNVYVAAKSKDLEGTGTDVDYFAVGLQHNF